jgi:hypothetical protein
MKDRGRTGKEEEKYGKTTYIPPSQSFMQCPHDRPT